MVLRELAKIGFSDIRKNVRWGKTELRVTDAGDDEGEVTEAYHGRALVGADDIDVDTAAAISEISEGREGLKVKLHDKKGAQVDIGRDLGMFKDRVGHSVPDGRPIATAAVSPETLRKAV